jgi:hypothetical protein
MTRIVAALPVLLALAAPAQASTLLRLDGIGPLTLGMKQPAAVGTGWLVHRGHGCPLGGKPYPVDYTLTGPRAPAGIDGTAEFNGATGRLDTLSFGKGVRTATGVVVGRTTATGMVTRYRNAGFAASARYDTTFQGTFVQVRRHKGGKLLMMGFASKSKLETIGIPVIPVCE